MKRAFLIALLAGFAVAAQAGDTKTGTKDVSPAGSACCSKAKTQQTSLEQPKAEPTTEAPCCGCCGSKAMAKKRPAVKPLFTPKGAELARR